MPSYEDLLSQIENLSKIPKQQLEEKIAAKEIELGGLVSKEGAAHLVARELGVNISSNEKKKIDLSNIMPGMKNVNSIGRIYDISKKVEFTRQDGSKGKVINLLLADNTGKARLPLWNDQTKIVEEQMANVGDVIQIENSFAKESIYGDIELSLGKFGVVRKLEDIGEIPSVEQLIKKHTRTENERLKIIDLTPGNFGIKATVVSIFKGNFIFHSCPFCFSKLEVKESKYFCPDHKEVQPKPNLFFSAILDDGTANIRAVFFRDKAESVLQTKPAEILSIEEEKRLKFVEERVLGKELLLLGRVRKSQIGDNLEIVVNEVKAINLFEEIKRISSSLDSQVGVHG